MVVALQSFRASVSIRIARRVSFNTSKFTHIPSLPGLWMCQQGVLEACTLSEFPPFNSDAFPSGCYPKRAITDVLGFLCFVCVCVGCGSSALGICPCEYAHMSQCVNVRYL